MGLLPSVTTILRCLHRQALVEWMCEQAALAVLTAPKLPGEQLDAFVHRVLNVEEQQRQEAKQAADLGSDIHEALESALRARPFDDKLNMFVIPVVEALVQCGIVIHTEKVLVGNGYAGTVDCITEAGEIIIWDFKTTKNPPAKPYLENRLQLSAYAKAFGNTGDKPIKTGNIYISTTEPGKFHIAMSEDWQGTYERGFKPLFEFWKWANNYEPKV